MYDFALHIAPAIFAAGGAWVAVKYEILILKRDNESLRKSIRGVRHLAIVAKTKIVQIATVCRAHHGTEIDINGFDDPAGDD